MKEYDVVILTEQRYKEDSYPDDYASTVILEDRLLQVALENVGLKVCKKAWDADFDWTTTKAAIVRSTWDYFHRYGEFMSWLEKVNSQTQLINTHGTLVTNSTKDYLMDLKAMGIHIPPTHIYNKGEANGLMQLFHETTWIKAVLKPVVGGGGRHTYLVDANNIHEYEDLFAELVKNESIMLQEFQANVVSKREVSHMVFGGEYSHSVLKKAKSGDFRVQDDFGGTVHAYEANGKEIEFALHVVKLCEPRPVYARVDVIWDNAGKLAVSELELIEPELWLRKNDEAADKLAFFVLNEMKSNLKLSN